MGTRPHALVRRLAWATTGLLVLSLAAMLVLSTVSPDPAHEPSWATILVGFGLLALVPLAVATLLAQLACAVGPRFRGTLTVGSDGLLATGARTRFIPRADIDAAWIAREPAGARLEIRLRNGDIFGATTATPAEATAVLDAAGVDASRRALRMPLGGAAATVGVGLAAAFPSACVAAIIAGVTSQLLAPGSAVLGFLAISLFVAFVVGAVQLLAPPLVAVGSDGLAVGVGRRAWFVPFEDIVEVTTSGADITLRLRDGRWRRISTLGTVAARREALHARIAAGIAAAQTPTELSVRLTALDRDGRSADAWRGSLQALAAARDDYRQTGLTRDEVQAALDDPRTSTERRIGAAFALAAMDPALAATRVRIVADTVAHEPVRIALEHAAAGELDEATLDAARDGRERG